LYMKLVHFYGQNFLISVSFLIRFCLVHCSSPPIRSSVISCCGFTFATIFVLPVSLGSRPVMFRPSSEEAESSSRLCFNRRRPESLPGFDSNRAPHRVESIARLWGLRFPLPICSRSPLKRIGKIFFCFLLLGSHSREQLVLAPSLILEAAACAL
jgi:hypothetical protein